MKRTLLTILILISITIAGFSQKLSGEYSNDGKSSGAYYTKIKWEVSYSFVEKNDLFYIKFYNPKITVPNYSLYHDEFGKEYSLADLNLASWPSSRQLPFAMSVKANVSDGYNNYESGASCNADFTCGDTYIATKANLKNVTLQNFRVTGVNYFRANLGGEPAVDNILKSKKQSAGKPSNTSNVAANTASANGAALPANISGSDPLANYTPTQTKQEVTRQVVAGAAIVAGGLLDNWSAAIERKEQRRDAERKANENMITKKYEAKFKAEFLPLMSKAKAGDENARMILYFTSDTKTLWDYVPDRWKWIDEAVKNNNTDALMEKAEDIFYRLMYKKEVKGNDHIYYIEKAANLGNTEAMLWTADYAHHLLLNKSPNNKKALELYNKAAEKGNPIAMYVLGMIYKYGYGSKIDKYNKSSYYAKFDVVLDEKTAFKWFLKSYETFSNDHYQESIFARSKSFGESRIFNNCIDDGNGQLRACLLELSKILKKGEAVLQDKKKAKEFEDMSTYYHPPVEKGKFNNIDNY